MARRSAGANPVGARELRRRQRLVCARIGEEILGFRTEAGISQTALAAAAGIDQGYLSRIEHGLVRPSLDVLVAIAACLGAELGVRLFQTAGPRLRDRFQAPMIECLIRALHPRWQRVPELAVPRARGVIDLALGLRTGDLAVACEAHSELRVLELILRRLQEKTAALAELGTFGSKASSLLLLRSTARNREVARALQVDAQRGIPGSRSRCTGCPYRRPGLAGSCNCLGKA